MKIVLISAIFKMYYVNIFCENSIPVALSIGGGYSHLLADTIDAHANTFRVTSDVYF
jgi:hypothetical protein